MDFYKIENNKDNEDDNIYLKNGINSFMLSIKKNSKLFDDKIRLTGGKRIVTYKREIGEDIDELDYNTKLIFSLEEIKKLLNNKYYTSVYKIKDEYYYWSTHIFTIIINNKLYQLLTVLYKFKSETDYDVIVYINNNLLHIEKDLFNELKSWDTSNVSMYKLNLEETRTELIEFIEDRFFDALNNK